MQVKQVQSNQQSFGTKVIIDPVAARQIGLSGAGRKVRSHIKALENNGINDVMFLSYAPYFKIRAVVIEHKGKDCFMSQFYQSENVKERLSDNKNKYVSLKDLYKRAKSDMTQVIIGKEVFEKLIPYIG